MSSERFHTPYRKVNPKWFEVLHLRHGSIKLLEENLGKTFSDINCTNVFLGQSPKAIEIKAKNKQMGSSKGKEVINKRKSQPMD